MGADNQAANVIRRRLWAAWFDKWGVDHAHCPKLCANPAPVFNEHDQLVCRRCDTEMVPCAGFWCRKQ